jgi:hypothetical protein
MQIPILNGIFTDSGPDIRTAYPVNLVPVPKASGISTGYLRPSDGIVANGTGPDIDRGGINYRGELYRVMGTKLVKVSNTGAVTVLGDVGGPVDDLVSFTYSFNELAVASGGRLYYWDGTTLIQVTDPDLGIVLDVVWVDGYFMTTDGEFLIVTELTDPTQVNPLKYGSSEADPDPVVALLKLRNEVYALNRNTIEVFDNVGGDLFPFERVEGAQIQKGAVGTHACCVYIDNIAFLGSGTNEPPSIFIGANGSTVKISTQEIDEILLGYTEDQLALVQLEARNDKSHTFLYVHLPDRTVVYDAAASKELSQQVWFTLTSSIVGFAQYRARNMVYAYDKWLVGDPQTSNIGFLDDTIGSHWGQKVRWQFGTFIIYNDSRGAIINEMELVGLTGRVALGIDPKISTSYSLDGLSFGQERFISVGTIGNTAKRLVWYQMGAMRNFRIQRFQGDSDSHISYARLEAQIEPLAY